MFGATSRDDTPDEDDARTLPSSPDFSQCREAAVYGN